MRVILEISEDSQLGGNFGLGAWGPGQDSLSQHRVGVKVLTPYLQAASVVSFAGSSLWC